MAKTKKLLLGCILGLVMMLSLCFGVVLSSPMKTAQAETIMSTSNWSLAREGDGMFRIQNGNTYWDTYTNDVTTASMLDNTEINGKTLSEINREMPGSITVTLQPAGGAIGSFYRVNINTEIAGFTVNDIGTVVVRAGWSHTDKNGTYTIDTDLYFAHGQNTWASDNSNWKYIPVANVVDITDDIRLQDQGIQAEATRSILISTNNNDYWTADPITPNEGNGAFLNMLYINGTSIKEWNNEAHAALNAGDITDITYGSGFWLVNNGPVYAPIAMSNSGYTDGLGSISQVWIPTGYISDVSSFKVAKGFANLQGDTLYYVSEDVEYVKSGRDFIKIDSSVDISDAFKILVQDRTAKDGTMLYYLHTNDVKYWTQQYGSTGAFAINEKEWKGQATTDLQGGAVQMSYLEFNGRPLYDINAADNASYGATQGNIASGSKYAPILAFLTPEEQGDSIKLQIPSKYPSGSGTAADNHKTLTIKKGFYVVDTSTNIKYEVTKDVQWDFKDGAWNEHYETIETTVTDARLFGSASDAFAGVALAGSDYSVAPSTYPGGVKTAKEFAQSANFLSHILIDDAPLATPGEAFLNVWGNYGYFTFRPGNNSATKITILAGCQFPTYSTLVTGEKVVYVTTEDVTFVKNASGEWEQYVPVAEGEFDTSVSSVVYARDNVNNWMMFTLSNKDYPSPIDIYNLAATEEQIAALNLYDKIVVDGYTLRNRIATYGKPGEAPKLNLWQANCFAIRVAGAPTGAEGAMSGAQRVTIKAGAQFPSYAYLTEGADIYYVTTEDVTFVNCGYTTGKWCQEYKITFVADGEVVGVSTYIYDEDETPTAPAVPEKAGYRGVWERYEVGSASNITVNAIYSKKPESLGLTSIKELRRIDNNSNLLIINPTNIDYPASAEGSWNLGLDVSHLEKFNLLDYITINGRTLRSLKVNSMAINKFTRAGLGLETSLSDSMTIVIKKGCEIPSYAFWQNPNENLSCYTVDATYTCVYSAGGEAAFTISSDSGAVTPDIFEKNYVLSDLYQVAYSKSKVFKDGFETLTNGGEESYRYGYVDTTSFSVSFDMKFTSANFYETLQVNLGTEGYQGNKFHFGWRFYLLRGSEGAITPNICVEYFSNTSTYGGNITGSANKAFGSQAFVPGETYHITIAYKLVDATTGTVYVYTSVNQYSREDTYVLGGDFVNFAPYANCLSFNTVTNGIVTISDPYMENVDGDSYNLYLNDGSNVVMDVQGISYELPALNPAACNKAGSVFVGWTTDLATLSTLYPAGYELALSEETTLYAVWIDFAMRDGAAVRKVEGSSGIRFLVDVDRATYDAWVQKGIVLELGTILAPTNYLNTREFTHALGNGYYMQIVTKSWQTGGAMYSAAFTNISPDQYTRSFSARGYMKIQYTGGAVAYIYTAYDAENNARTIYDVATAAYKDDKDPENATNAAILSYVNSVADITIDDNFVANKNTQAVGAYNVDYALDGANVTVTVDSSVKAVVVNGVRLIMGNDTTIMIDGVLYVISEYKMNAVGTSITFSVETRSEELTKEYYVDKLYSYLDSNEYTAEHEELVDSIAQAAIEAMDGSDWKSAAINAIAELSTIKTAAEMQANNTSKVILAQPALAKGLGYTVTWNAVENADYYTIHDNNSYRTYAVVKAGETLSYKAEVVGNHNVYVVAHSYYEAYNDSDNSNTVATPEVKPVFSYKSMSDGLYKFSSSQMSTMGIPTSGYYYDSSDKKYFAYYSKELGWTPYPSQVTDWTSPAEFPAHAQRLKDMGNNIILIARDTNAEFKANETWEASRMRYVMDTAWSMGMKVLVCDEVFYKLSMSDNSGTGATSLSQVQTAIANRGDDFKKYVTHPAFYGFSLDDEPYGKYISAMSHTISALNTACENLGVDPFFLACLFQAQGGELGKELYLTQSSLEEYYNKWLAIDGVDGEYLYVDIYTQHAMDQPTNRYNTSFEVVYDEDYLGGKYKFHQAITAHTQNDGVLLEQDLYMSLLYAAAHNVAGYSWFCYFPIAGELAGCMVGYDGNGYGNGIGNNVENGKSFYNAAKTAGYQYELIQGLLDGYEWKTRDHNDSKNLLTTTLSNGSKTATMYVNADVDNMSGSVTVTASGSECYLVGYNVGTAEAPYQAVSGSVTLAPGQAVICIS